MLLPCSTAVGNYAMSTLTLAWRPMRRFYNLTQSIPLRKKGSLRLSQAQWRLRKQERREKCVRFLERPIFVPPQLGGPLGAQPKAEYYIVFFRFCQ